MTSGESTYRKSLDLQVWKSLALGMVPGNGTEALQRCGEYTYYQGVRGHLSVSLPPLSSPTLPLFICIPPPHLCTISRGHN
jgi:hypothetical protein